MRANKKNIAGKSSGRITIPGSGFTLKRQNHLGADVTMRCNPFSLAPIVIEIEVDIHAIPWQNF